MNRRDFIELIGGMCAALSLDPEEVAGPDPMQSQDSLQADGWSPYEIVFPARFANQNGNWVSVDHYLRQIGKGKKGGDLIVANPAYFTDPTHQAKAWWRPKHSPIIGAPPAARDELEHRITLEPIKDRDGPNIVIITPGSIGF